MAVCDRWVALKVLEFLVCVACLVAKRISADDEVRLALLLQKLSREWSLLTSVTWDNVGGSFADAVYGGYTIITFGLLLARIFQEIPKGRRILEGFLLGLGMLFFLIIGGLELASLDSVPPRLVVNASVMGAFSLIAAALFLIDLMGPRIYTATHHVQTDTANIAIVNNDIKKNSNALQQPPMVPTQQAQNGHVGNGHLPHDKQKGTVANEKQNSSPNGLMPIETDLGQKNDKNISRDETDLFDKPKNEFPKTSSPLDPEGLGKSKFGSLRDDFEGGNYVRLSDPMAEPDRIHYERELAKFHENYFRNYLETNLDDYAGRFIVKEGYLPEPHTPMFAKAQTGRLRSLHDDVSPTYEKKRSTSKSPTRVRTVATPTLQQLEDYLRSPSRTRRSETPLFPIDETGKDLYDEGRASGTPTDPGYVQYTAGKWPDRREIRTPRHSPTE